MAVDGLLYVSNTLALAVAFDAFSDSYCFSLNDKVPFV